MQKNNILVSLCLILALYLQPAYSRPAGQIVFTPQWTPQSQFAGYYVALEKGFFRQAGLDVVIRHPSASNQAMNNLMSDKCQVITLQLVNALENIDRGFPLVNILQTSQRNSLMIVPRNDSIRTIDDLRGKRVGIWKAGFGELGYILNNSRQLNIEWIPFISNINLFISGAVDATLAMSYNEYLQILACGIQPSSVFYFEDLGYDIPEEGLYVTTTYYESHKQELKAFVEAVKQGWKWAAAHPEETLDIVMQYVRRANVPTNRIHQRKMLQTVLHLQCPKGTDTPSFRLDPRQVEQTVRLLHKYGRISTPISFNQIHGKL